MKRLRQSAAMWVAAIVAIAAASPDGLLSPPDVIIPALDAVNDATQWRLQVGPVATWRDKTRIVERTAASNESTKELEGGRLSTRASMLVWETPLEPYLAGVVAAEIGADAPDAALEVQAILSRTWALRGQCEPIDRGNDVHLMLGEQSQAYRRAVDGRDRIDAALARTEGIVLARVTDESSHVPTAALATVPFHACCGGFTSRAPVAWPISTHDAGIVQWRVERPSATQSRLATFDLSREKAVLEWIAESGRDGWCHPSRAGAAGWGVRQYRWQRAISAADAGKLGIESWRVLDRGVSGHLARIATPSGEKRGDTAIRGMLQPALPSTRFVWMKQQNGGYMIRGAGHGHGVGVCQACTRAMAAEGMSTEDILASFLEPGVQPVRWMR